MGNWKTGGEDDVDADGKYLLISVPEFKEDPISGRKMTSYVRLGASSSTWEKDPGGDLQSKVRWPGVPGGIGNAPGSQVAYTNDGAQDGRPVFVEDRRSRDGSPPPEQVAGGARETESGHLHTRGGWRDHTDGNRITTTYGDKIEIIRGNYKLIVLGRQDDIEQAAGRDISGQHIQDFAYTWPASQRVEWTPEYGGVWHIQETTDGAVTSTHFAGDQYEWSWGNKFQSITGSESPVELEDPPNPLGRKPRGNPHIIEKTWAKKIEGYTGSAAWRIPSIHEETWAVATTSITDVTTVSETSTIGASSSIETVGAKSEISTVGTQSSIATVGTSSDIAVTGAKAEIAVTGASAGIEVVGAEIALKVAGLTTAINLEIANIEFALRGLHIAFNLVKSEHTATIGVTEDAHLGEKLTIEIPQATHVTVHEEEFALYRGMTALMTFMGVG
ncbi:MAG: hypothetical protein R3F14_36385 [Polyangiaceae bacterium]